MRHLHLALVASLGFHTVGCEAPDPAGRGSGRVIGVPPPAAAPALSVEAQAKEYSVASRPGSAHQVLQALIGEWDVTLSTLAADGSESAPPYRGRATLAWTLGGRFVRWDASLLFGETAGTTTGFLGFNTRTRQYQLMMISDLATGMVIADGSGEIRGAGILFELEEFDAESGSRMIARSRIRSISPDHFVLEQIEPSPNGKDRVARVSHYSRAVTTR